MGLKGAFLQVGSFFEMSLKCNKLLVKLSF